MDYTDYETCDGYVCKRYANYFYLLKNKFYKTCDSCYLEHHFYNHKFGIKIISYSQYKKFLTLI